MNVVHFRISQISIPFVESQKEYVSYFLSVHIGPTLVEFPLELVDKNFLKSETVISFNYDSAADYKFYLELYGKKSHSDEIEIASIEIPLRICKRNRRSNGSLEMEIKNEDFLENLPAKDDNDDGDDEYEPEEDEYDSEDDDKGIKIFFEIHRSEDKKKRFEAPLEELRDYRSTLLTVSRQSFESSCSFIEPVKKKKRNSSKINVSPQEETETEQKQENEQLEEENQQTTSEKDQKEEENNEIQTQKEEINEIQTQKEEEKNNEIQTQKNDEEINEIQAQKNDEEINEIQAQKNDEEINEIQTQEEELENNETQTQKEEGPQIIEEEEEEIDEKNSNESEKSDSNDKSNKSRNNNEEMIENDENDRPTRKHFLDQSDSQSFDEDDVGEVNENNIEQYNILDDSSDPPVETEEQNSEEKKISIPLNLSSDSAQFAIYPPRKKSTDLLMNDELVQADSEINEQPEKENQEKASDIQENPESNEQLEKEKESNEQQEKENENDLDTIKQQQELETNEQQQKLDSNNQMVEIQMNEKQNNQIYQSDNTFPPLSVEPQKVFYPQLDDFQDEMETPVQQQPPIIKFSSLKMDDFECLDNFSFYPSPEQIGAYYIPPSLLSISIHPPGND